MSRAADTTPGAGRPDTGRILRSSAVVGVGTALSRATGFLRVAAIAYALGVSTLAGVYSYANETPNIVYELLLGGVLTATLVPLFVTYFEDRDDEATSAVVTVAVLALVGITIVGELLAPLIVRLYTINVSGPQHRGPTRARNRPPALLHAADVLLRLGRARDRVVAGAPPLRRRRVRAGAQQRRRRRTVPRAPAARGAADHRRRAC